jgi:GAF domain-containing protein
VASEREDEVVRVAEMFGQVARLLSAHEGLIPTLNRIVNLAVEHLRSCEFAGISLVEGRRITSPASSNDIPRTVDAIQSEVGEGPCLDAIKEHEVFQTGDLGAEERWPQFAGRAHEETGIRSILSVRLFIEEDTMGALNLYSSAANAFDETDVAMAAVYASHAAVAMSAARREENLERKASSRDLIGRAKGILMARSDLSDQQAFDLLKRASQRLNIKLVDVAERVVHPAAGDEAPSG